MVLLHQLYLYLADFWHIYLNKMSDNSHYTPVGNSMFWEPSLMSFMIMANLVLWFSYFWIALQLSVLIVRKFRVRGSVILIENTSFLAFMLVFMVFGSSSYLMTIVTYFYPYYYVQMTLTILYAFFCGVTASLVQLSFKIVYIDKNVNAVQG